MLIVCDTVAIRRRIFLARLIIDHADINTIIFGIYSRLIREQYITERINAQLVLAEASYVSCFIRDIDIFVGREFYSDCIYECGNHERICQYYRKKLISIGYTIVDDIFIVNILRCGCKDSISEENYIIEWPSVRQFLRLLFDNDVRQYIGQDSDPDYLFFMAPL